MFVENFLKEKTGRISKMKCISRLLMTGGRGSSSTPPRGGMVNSVALVWLIKKFGVGFGISSCDKEDIYIYIYYYKR